MKLSNDELLSPRTCRLAQWSASPDIPVEANVESQEKSGDSQVVIAE